MVTISLCMIVKNEEDVLERCLESVGDVVDEIIIVDTGSTDNTKEIANKWTSKRIDFKWIDDFSAARNFAFDHASMDYVFWLDADDVIMEPDRQKLIELKQTLDPLVDAVSMHYHLALDSEGNVSYRLLRNRLVKRTRGFRWYGAVHEYLQVGGYILNSNIAITHLPLKHDLDRNLRIYERRLAAGDTFTPRDLFYYANECMDHQNFERAIEYYELFLSSKQGWVEDNILACDKLSDCYYYLGDPDKSREYALKSFEYDTPRAEFCCRLGYEFMQRQKWRQAIFWYELATKLEKPVDSWGFINDACWTWLPHVQLCVCYDRLGQHDLAYEHNEIARQYRPNDDNVLHNKKYLESILQK